MVDGGKMVSDIFDHPVANFVGNCCSAPAQHLTSKRHDLIRHEGNKKEGSKIQI